MTVGTTPEAPGSIPTLHFLANETYPQALLLAYNLVNWFKRLSLPPEYQTATLETLRYSVLLMTAQLRRGGNRPWLTLLARGSREGALSYILRQVNALQ